MISIIIPAFNEEKYLPFLISSIKAQGIKCEIIVADNRSTDKTKDIAKKHGCRIVEGGNPAKARNNGAKYTKNDLLFIDADTILPVGFLKKFLEKIRKENLDYASCRIDPISINSHHKFCYMLKNYGNAIACIYSEHASGQCLFVKRSAFLKVKGYDDSLYLGEEHDLARRLKKIGKGKMIMDLCVLNFPRRLEKDGIYGSLAKDIFSELYRGFIGPIKHKIYDRKYGHY